MLATTRSALVLPQFRLSATERTSNTAGWFECAPEPPKPKETTAPAPKPEGDVTAQTVVTAMTPMMNSLNTKLEELLREEIITHEQLQELKEDMNRCHGHVPVAEAAPSEVVPSAHVAKSGVASFDPVAPPVRGERQYWSRREAGATGRVRAVRTIRPSRD